MTEHPDDRVYREKREDAELAEEIRKRGVIRDTAAMAVTEKRELYRRAIPWLLGLLLISMVMVGFAGLVFDAGKQREQERIVARYVICEELEKLKEVQRIRLRQQIKESQAFLKANPDGIPGIPASLIQRGIDRNKDLLTGLSPYPNGCAAFARDPDRLNVRVPEVP
jgi:hypothetical protein